jgi:LSD1 subclass zinc finger protein
LLVSWNQWKRLVFQLNCDKISDRNALIILIQLFHCEEILMSQTFNCPNCNAPLDYERAGALTVRCPYCNSSVVVPEALRSVSRAAAHEDPWQRAQASMGLPDVGQLAKLKEIGDLVRSGNKIGAIKIFRETFDVGLKEAKDAVEALERGEPVTLTHVDVSSQGQVTPLGGGDLEATVRSFLAQGRKIEAIKVYREATDLGLKESKDAVEAIERGASLEQAQWKAQVVNAPQRANAQVVNARVARGAATAAGATAAGAGCFGGIGLVVFIVLVTVVPILFAMTTQGGPLAEPWARINPFGKTRLELSFGGEGTGVGVFEDARHVAVDNQGHIFVGEYAGGRIQVFDETGKFIIQWLARGEAESNDDVYITGMAADRSGVVYITVGGGLYRYNGLTGELLGEIQPPAENGYCDWVTVAPDGSLVTLWSWSSDDIVRFNRDGNVGLIIQSAVSSVDDDDEVEKVAGRWGRHDLCPGPVGPLSIHFYFRWSLCQPLWQRGG